MNWRRGRGTSHPTTQALTILPAPHQHSNLKPELKLWSVSLSFCPFPFVSMISVAAALFFNKIPQVVQSSFFSISQRSSRAEEWALSNENLHRPQFHTMKIPFINKWGKNSSYGLAIQGIKRLNGNEVPPFSQKSFVRIGRMFVFPKVWTIRHCTWVQRLPSAQLEPLQTIWATNIFLKKTRFKPRVYCFWWQWES